MEKIFLTVETVQPNYGKIFFPIIFCRKLFRLFFFLNRKCLFCQNTKVIKLMHGMLTLLMAIFATDSHHKHDELEILYAAISRMISDGLATYEKNPQANPSTLFGTLMILIACCTNNQSYIDRLIMPLMSTKMSQQM